MLLRIGLWKLKARELTKYIVGSGVPGEDVVTFFQDAFEFQEAIGVGFVG